MEKVFKDRNHAGEVLAELLSQRNPPEPVVLALPRGGVPLGKIVAEKLEAPLDLILVRKIGLPGQEEVAVGAVVDGDPPILVFNEDIMESRHLSEDDLSHKIEEKIKQINERRSRYFADSKPVTIEGKTAIIIDDGMATGATALAAVRGLRERNPAKIILAVPVSSQEAYERLKAETDEIICPRVPELFYAVGAHFTIFGQVSDDEVIEIMKNFRN